jgi:hypothetical protein
MIKGEIVQNELTRLLPRNKEDVKSVAGLLELGYPTIGPVLPNLFDWLKTNGSPVELQLRVFFANLGEPSLPLVQRALSSGHELWIFTALRHVAWHWPKTLVAALQGDLERLLQSYGFYPTDLVALNLLGCHGLLSEAQMLEWTSFKRQRLQEHMNLLDTKPPL